MGDTLDMLTSGASTLKADTILLMTDSASVALSQTAAIDGTSVLLKQPPPAAQFPNATPTPPTTIELVDQTGKPIANQRFVATYADGSVLGGITDAAGNATLMLDQSGTISFPDLTNAKKS